MLSFDELIQEEMKESSAKIEELCKTRPGFRENIQLLDSVNLSNYLHEGEDIMNIVHNIEAAYDDLWFNNYHKYAFEYFETNEEMKDYFTSRYILMFRPYTSWVVRKNNGVNSAVAKR